MMAHGKNETSSASAGRMQMTSTHYSKITLPEIEQPYPTILQFLMQRFPHVSPGIWEERLRDGKVTDDEGNAVTARCQYVPGKRIHYFREVAEEPVIPFAETILFQNEDLLVACKPHFLPVNPTGPYVAECLMNRLRKTTGNPDLVPINRIDRETAGLVLFSAEKKTRDCYCRLFREGNIEKMYEAVSALGSKAGTAEWSVENRIEKGEPWFRMRIVPGEANSRSMIRLVEAGEEKGRFLLQPLTGKTHQLRLHMSSLGFGILNDRYYPDLLPESPDDFEKPLQLLAKTLRFCDPLTGKNMEFSSERRLNW